MKAKLVMNQVAKVVSKNMPKILLGLGVAGGIGTTVLAVKQTVKAVDHINAKKEELETEELTKKEVVKTVYKDYIPVAVLGLASVTCVICSSHISEKRHAALAAAYKLTETTLHDYISATDEVVSSQKKHEIDQKFAEKQKERNDEVRDGSTYAPITIKKGETICFDLTFDHMFSCNLAKIHRVIDELNRRFKDGEDFITLNEVRAALDSENLRYLEAFEDLGWNSGEDFNNIIRIGSMHDENGEPRTTVVYLNPHYDENDPRQYR